MATKTIEELKEEISLHPVRYKQALNRQTTAFLEVERLEREIEKLKNTLLSEVQPEADELTDENDESIESIKLEQELEKLKLRLAKTECAVELDVRRTSEKMTESYVKALIGSNDEVCQLKEQLIDAKANLKVKQAEIARERRERWEKERVNRSRSKPSVESKELAELNLRLAEAKAEQFDSTDEVEALKARLETYRLLVQLESLEGIIS